MKTKIAGLASTALLLLAPISGAFSAVAESQVVQAENNWDYDTADPGLGEYDRLLQNAGPSDGQIDWYPAEHFASSSNIRPSLLVKQLIDLSIATNNANSKARKVLFNDTTGSNTNSDSEYQDTYKKYNLALGFIAQLLAFNNEKTGKGAYLKQGFESTNGTAPAKDFDDEDKIAETGQNPDRAILGIPAIGEGVNISDVLGRAFFGNADDAYAQLYVNGYDNTVQNAPNIIRETTTSITIVAQSKLTGRKATAIFKLNNKTFNNLPDGVLLENKIDNSPSFAGSWGNENIPDGEEKNLGDSTDGTFNQRGNLVTGLTGDQKRLLSNGGSSAWVDPKTGSGTIVVPRGTSAAEIAKKIKQLGYKSNYNISNVAPMKSIHGDKYSTNRTEPKAITDDNSYNVTFGSITNGIKNAPLTGGSKGNVTALSDDDFSSTGKTQNYFAVADPRLKPDDSSSDLGFNPANNAYDEKKLDSNFTNSILYNSLNTNRPDKYGFNNSLDGYSNSTAATIPNQYDYPQGNAGAVFPDVDHSSVLTSSYPKLNGTGGIDPAGANNQLGDVIHAFEPKNNAPLKDTKSPFMVREAWDDTHAIFGTAPFTGLTEEEIKNQIANNGSFNNTSGDQIKKSFTFNMPLNNSVMKSYRNPYSTVISTALPFASGFATTGDSAFSKGEHYDSSDTIDMNNDGFTSTYKTPAKNPWYENAPSNTDADMKSTILDKSGHELGLTNGIKANMLHISSYTWSSKVDSSGGYDEPKIHNVTSTNTSPENEITGFNNWFSTRSAGDNRLKVKEYPRQGASGSEGDIEDANNKNYRYKFSESTTNYSEGADFPTSITMPSSTGPVRWPDASSTTEPNFDSQYASSETHKQLASNIGYVLINAEGLSEATAQKLSDFQLPKELVSTHDYLDGIANRSYFKTPATAPTSAVENFLSSFTVDDDSTYRGGLLGVMSIWNKNTDLSTRPLAQEGASSIYNPKLLSSGDQLQIPGTNIKIKVDGSASGSKYLNTNLQYGLAWNDSSDLPQVKIERSLNAQYLVPVSIARDVTTTWYQYNKNGRVLYNGTTLYWDPAPTYERRVETLYHTYSLYLGNVKLNGDNKGVDSASLEEIKPVNNQIQYKRIDQSHPHYDSELFDHGSNKEDVTVKRGNSGRNFVGDSKEINSSSDPINEENVGSSDDYSIGIVKAPKNLFNVGDDGVPTTGALTASHGTVDSTENRAIGQEGINQYTDDPKNSNGMPIGKASSYATLAQAYNVEINGNKAVGKADDTAKNKGDRVALVQQLLDNGGNAEAYYYIPSLPRLYEKWNEARINVVVYDKAAVPAPSKAETKPSFSTTDVSTGNDPFNVNLRPYTTVYDDGAVLKESDVPQNFKNLLTRELVAGNTDLVTSDGQVATEKLQQILVGAFLNSWQQNDGSFNQTDTGAGVNSPLYLYGGFGISNSDSKNSYSQWPDGYTTPNLSSSKYHEAVTNYPGDFYRGGKDLKTTGATVIKGIPATALKADVSKVDLSKAGTYPVVYTYTNPSNDKDSASITVPVTVTDGAAPVFAFQGGSDLTIKVGESFDRSAFKVVGSWQIFNKYQGDYDKLVNYEGIAKNSKGEPDVTISGDVDTQTPGIYQLTYKATSIGGAVTTMKRNITVLPKETTGSDWKVSDFTSVGYVNYVPNYGINVWNAPAGTFTGQRLTHGTSWKIFQRAVNSQGKVYYNVGKNQWIDGAYVSFTPVSAFQPLNGIVTINYVRGYGVNLWKAPKTTGGYYEGRKLQHGTKWKVFGIQDGFYKVGGNQWIQAKYAKFQAR